VRFYETVELILCLPLFDAACGFDDVIGGANGKCDRFSCILSRNPLEYEEESGGHGQTTDISVFGVKPERFRRS
jgi:hypothetical protein